MTSRFEGHPISVLDALAHGIPCLLTPGTNMAAQVASERAGWEVEPTAVSIARGIEEILRGNYCLTDYGNRAREMAIREFAWSYVADRTIQCYKEVLNNRGILK